jgi:hypothetical protein
VDIITAADLAAWLRDTSLATDDSLEQIVELTNDLITDSWTDPDDPVPVRIKMLALSIAARAWVNSPALSNVESTSVRVDDAGTTQRFRSPARLGVYLTADELALLNGEQRTRSVRLTIYGEV